LREAYSRFYFISRCWHVWARLDFIVRCVIASLTQRFEQRVNAGIVAKRLADVRESIYVSWAEDEAAAELERILPQLVLRMAGGPRSLAGFRVVTAQ
jgi:hypothetical protein